MQMRSFVSMAFLLAAGAGQAFGQVQHGIINVTELDGGNTSASVSVSRSGGFGAWSVVNAGCDRGDFALDFGTGSDNTLGVMFTSPYQVQRSEASFNAGIPYFGVSMAARNGTGYKVAVWQAGTTVAPATDNAEINLNTAVAFFPVADGWLSGHLLNSANNGVMTSVVGNVSLRTELTYTGTGNEVLDYSVTGTPSGFYLLHSDTIDFRRDGVLLACGGKDEDNRASWSTNYVTGEAFIQVQDVGADSTSGENDPAAFVFIPEGTAGVTMGTVTATAKTLFKQGNFTVSMLGEPLTDGTFDLRVEGETPATGSLMLSPYIRPDRAGTTIDNPVWAEPNGDNTGWIITTRDQPGMALQDLTVWDVAFSFAFLKNDVAITPGTPARAYLTQTNEVAATRFEVSEFSPDNGNGDMDCFRAAGNSILDVAGANRGDNQISYLGALLPSAYDNGLDTQAGLMLGSVSQFLRDNTITGGVSGWSTLGFDNGDAVSHNASITGGEMNSNFSLVHFAASRGFLGNSDQAMPSGLLSLASTSNALTDGVLMAINWDNNNRIIQVTPNGANFDLTAYEAQNVVINTVSYAMGAIAVDSVEVGYVFLPFSTPGIIAGHIAADGTELAGAGDFSVATGTDATYGFPILELTIPGVNASTDGVLLLNASSGPYAMAWEPGENGEFEIAGLELLSGQPGACAFSFAYIPYSGFGVGPSCPWQADGCYADFNNDGGIDGDDVIAFFADWDSGAICADADSSTGVDGDDVIAFFGSWDNSGAGSVGCE